MQSANLPERVVIRRKWRRETGTNTDKRERSQRGINTLKDQRDTKNTEKNDKYTL